MSGQLISDHKFWGGSKPKGSVFPEHAKMKEEHSAEGSGKLDKYEDTTEAIRAVQSMQDKNIKGHPMKDGYRN